MSDARSFEAFVEQAQAERPQAAIVLGSGMSGVAARCRISSRRAFAEIPGLSTTTVAGHSGCLTLGDWAGKRVLIFEGRLHYYEGHPWQRVTQPIQLAHALGTHFL